MGSPAFFPRNRPQRGDTSINAAYFEDIEKEVRRLNPMESATLKLIRTTNGFTYEMVTGGTGQAKLIGARVYSNGQTLNVGDNVIEWDGGEVFDTGSFFDSGNNTYFTIPTAGIYLVGASLGSDWDILTGTIESSSGVIIAYDRDDTEAGNFTFVNPMCLAYLSASAQIRVVANHGDGSAHALQTPADPDAGYPIFWIVRFA